MSEALPRPRRRRWSGPRLHLRPLRLTGTWKCALSEHKAEVIVALWVGARGNARDLEAKIAEALDAARWGGAMAALDAFSPDPDFLARKMAEARLEEHKLDCTDCALVLAWESLKIRPDCFGPAKPAPCERIAELERDLAAIGEGT